MSITVRILAALLLGTPAFSCLADAAIPASTNAQTPTTLQKSALWQYQRALVDPAYPVVEQMQQSRTALERMVKLDQRSASSKSEKLARFEQWLSMLQADIQGQRKAGITRRNAFLAGTEPSEIHTRLASFACAEAVTLGEGSFSANLSAQQTVWIALQSDAKQTVQVNTIGSNVDTKIAVYDQRCPTANQDANELRDDDLGLAARYELEPARAVRKYLAISADQSGDIQIRVALANGTIRGKVTTPTSNAYNGNVTAGRYENGYFSYSGHGYTQNDGTYSISLSPNSYYVLAQSGNPGSVLPQVYPAQPCFGQFGGAYCTILAATQLTVPDGGLVDGINFNLTEGGSISGRITGQSSGSTPSVYVYFPDGSNNYLQANVDTVGRFRVIGLPNVTVKMSAGANGAQTQLFNGVNCPQSGCVLSLGTPIPVVQGVERGNINFNLENLPTISGTVSGGQTYSYVTAYTSSGNYYNTQANSTGKYSITLQPGSYYLSFQSTGYVPQLYANKPCFTQTYQNSCSNFADGTPVVLGLQQNVIIDATLVRQGSVSGQVLDDLGAPVVGASVRACSAIDTSVCSSNYGFAQAQTNQLGNYSISGLSAGDYYFIAVSDSHLDKAYPNVGCQITPGVSCNPEFSGASAVSVEDNVQRTGINFSLDRSSSISGAFSGSPYYYYAGVEAARAGYTAGIYSQLVTITNESYKMFDLPAGEYRLIAGRQAYVVFAQIFANRSCAGTLASPCQISTGDPITLNQFSNVSGKDFSFAQRFGASGYVRNSNGTAIPNAIVDYWQIQQAPLLPQRTYSTLSDNLGRFSIVANTYSGNFYLSTDAPSFVSNQIYAGIQCAIGTSAYAGTCSFASATVLTAPAQIPGQLDNIIFSLPLTGLNDGFFAHGFESRGD